MKRKNTFWILSLCVFLLFSAGAIVFGLSTPKTKKITPIIDSNVTSIASQQSGTGFYYSGAATLTYVSEEGEQTVALDLANETEGKRIHSLFEIEGKNQILAYADNQQAYVLEEKENGLTLVGSFPYSGIPLQVTQNDKELYVVYEAKYCEVRVYDLENLSDNYIRRGVIYKYGGKKDGNIVLSIATGLRPVYTFVKENKLYMVDEGGIYMMDTSMKMNDFKYLTEEECAAKGAVCKRNDVEIAEEYFDHDAIQIYTTQVSASCYHEASDKIYFIDNNRKLVYYPLADMGTQEIGTTLRMTDVENISIQEAREAKPTMYYDSKNGIGYITFSTVDDLVCVDFATETVIFNSKGQFDVRHVEGSSDAKNVLMMYQDTVAGSNEARYLNLIDADKQANRNLYETLILVCIILAAISLVLTIFAVRMNRSDSYNKKVKTTLKKIWKHKWIYIILIPSLTGLIMFCYYPGIASLGLSFFDYTAEKQSMKWNNFANYIDIFTNKNSLLAFRNMVIFAATDVLTALIPPLIFAFFLTFMRSKKFSNLTRTMLFIPGIIPAIAGTLIWNTGIYGEYGVLNTLIKNLGGEPVRFLTSSGSALTSIIMMGFPFIGSYLIFYGAIMNIADSYIEAAELEGCPLLYRLIKIDIPLIMPQLKYVLIMTLISTAQNFNRVYMTTGGDWGTQIPINDMYNRLVAGNYGQSSAYAAVLFMIMFIPMMLNLKSQKKGME